MKTPYFLLFLCCYSLSLTAQQNPQLQLPTHRNHLSYHYLGKAATPLQLSHYLLEQLPYLQHPNVQLVLTQHQNKAFADYYTFEQQYQQQTIYGSHLKVTVNKQGYVLAISDNTFQLSNIAAALPKPTSRQEDWDRQYLHPFLAQQKATEKRRQSVYFMDTDQQWHFGYLVYAQDIAEPANINTHLFSADGKCYQSKDITRYHHQNTTATATAMVFDPDPLTTAQKNYGQNNQFKDRNDQDAPELSEQRRQVNIEVSEQNGTYSLKNDFIEIIDLNSAPIVPAVQSNSPNFDFLRNNDAFEDVNAYFHTNQIRNYVNSLGFEDMTTPKLFVDTHALNGEDQSKYVYFGTERQLFFGEGGVDDAEDADVIVHEYGHYLSDVACPSCNTDCGYDTQRSALDEALCDYFATSYSRRYSEFNWQNMFSWDGHNEFWIGRNMDNSKHYPEDIDNSYYKTSEIFSAALMDIWEVLGYQTTDQILLGAMYNFTPCTTLAQAAEQLLLSDQLQFDGQHEAVLYQQLSGRGLLSYRKPNAGNDTTICLGASLTLGKSIVQPADAQLFWSPGLTLNDSTTAYPIANPDRTTAYSVTLKNPANNLSYSDTVVVNVVYCLQSPVNDIQLLNTDRFLKGRGDLVLSIPDTIEQLNVSFYTISGQLLKTLTYEQPSEYLLFNVDVASAGVYILKVVADNKTQLFKVVKAR